MPRSAARHSASARSRSLAQLCAAKAADVIERGKDRYGRTIGRMTCAGIEANSEQVRRGMAWAFKRYVPVGSALYELEAYARLRHLGLWADAKPTAPWEWRAAKRQREPSLERFAWPTIE